MTHDPLLDDLRAANPVPDPDALELPATLAARALAGPEPRAPRAPRAPRRRLLPAAGVLAAAGAAVAILLLALGGGGAGTPDLAARAYAATATSHGVTHWQIDMFNYTLAGKLGMHQRTEAFKRGATLHTIHSEFHHGKEHVTADVRTVGHRSTTWMSFSDTYSRLTLPRKRSTSGEDVVFRDGDPILAFRSAYQQHRLRDLGHGRFDVVFKHLPPGSVVYEVDPGSGRPLRLVLTNANGSHGVWKFTTYETLPDTRANRDRLLLLPHPGAGPGDQDPAAYFGALRDGARIPARWQRVIDRTAHEHDAFGTDPSTARVLTKDVFLVAGDHYLCMDSVAMPEGSPKLVRLLGPSLGGTCVPIKKAIAGGISVGEGGDTVLAVPDGTTAVDARRWTGAWRRYRVHDGYARLPGSPGHGSYQVRLVS